MTKKINKSGSRSGNSYGFTSLTYGRRIILMFCFFVVMMILASFASQLAAKFATPNTRNFYILTSIFQNLIGFAGTALITALFMSTRPFAMLGLTGGVRWLNILGIILVFSVGIPFLNQVVWWNEQLRFPESMGALEQIVRGWEENAASAIGIMLGGKSVGVLLVNILIMGIFTGFCEELVFRGAFQRVIASGIGAHAAIWITAVIFSLLHFQFFGFFPRMLLGAFFGYLLYWTGSIWVPAIAHALNNSITIATSWFIANGMWPQSMDSIGVTTHGFPVIPCISLILIVCVLFGMKGYLFNAKRS